MNNIEQDRWMFHKGKVIDFRFEHNEQWMRNISLPIYVIGDSHVRVLVDAAPYIFKSSQVDIEDVFISKTAYAIGDEKYLNDAIDNIPKGSNVLLSFGEIDCRHHVPKWAKKNKTTIEEEVIKVGYRYFDNCIIPLKEKFKVTIMGAYVCPDDHNHENDYEDIYKAKFYFNSFLKGYCARWNLGYVPLFEFGLNNGYDKLEIDYPHYFNDTSHLGACMIPVILDAIKNNNL